MFYIYFALNEDCSHMLKVSSIQGLDYNPLSKGKSHHLWLEKIYVMSFFVIFPHKNRRSVNVTWHFLSGSNWNQTQKFRTSNLTPEMAILRIFWYFSNYTSICSARKNRYFRQLPI